MIWLVVIAGIVLGAAGAWIAAAGRLKKLELDNARLERDLEAERTARRQAEQIAARDSQAQAAAAESRLADLRQLHAQQLQEWRDSEARLRTQLEALLPQVAQNVLGSASVQLAEVARGELRLIGERTSGEVGKSHAEMRQSLAQMLQRLEQYQERIQKLETERTESATRLEQQILGLQSTGADMSQEARRLREALVSGSGVRGRWGEAELKLILESSGLTEGRGFVMQSTLAGEERLRPDAIVRLPSGRNLVIDSKASLGPFFEALEESDEARRRKHLQELANKFKERAKELAGKEYSRNLENSVPCVVMFVPSEAAFRAAVDVDKTLFAYGTELQPPVIITTPSTLMPLVLTIAYGWQQQQIAQQAELLHRELEIFIDRLRVYVEHVDKIGAGLAVAVNAYEKANRSYLQRLLPQAERMRELGADFSPVPEPRTLPPSVASLPAPSEPAARAAGESE